MSFVVFDSQGQRYMTIDSPYLKKEFEPDYTLPLMGVVSCFGMSFLSFWGVPYFGLLGKISGVAFAALPIAGFCNNYVRDKCRPRKMTALQLQNYVEWFGWKDFRVIEPMPGVPCYVVNYKDPVTSPV